MREMLELSAALVVLLPRDSKALVSSYGKLAAQLVMPTEEAVYNFSVLTRKTSLVSLTQPRFRESG